MLKWYYYTSGKTAIENEKSYGYADRTTLSQDWAHTFRGNELPWRTFDLAQMFDIEHERPASRLRTVTLHQRRRVLRIVYWHYIYFGSVGTARILRVPGSRVLVVQVLETRRQHLHHLVGPENRAND